jgi:hypothetical protein
MTPLIGKDYFSYPVSLRITPAHPLVGSDVDTAQDGRETGFRYQRISLLVSVCPNRPDALSWAISLIKN